MSAVLFVREDLLKASHYKTITVPGHLHGGQWVSPYQKKVLVSDDHNDLNVAGGFGSFYQKQAHKKLSLQLDHFHAIPPEDKAAIILSHATDLQDAASSSAAVSGFKASMLAGKVPTPAQYLAMQNAPASVQSKVADACAAAIGDEKYEQLLMAASAKANQTFVDRITTATTTKQLATIWLTMQEKAFLSYQVDVASINASVHDFNALPIEDQKRFLIEVLDKNLLYVPLSEMDDKTYGISESDKALNRAFFRLGAA